MSARRAVLVLWLGLAGAANAETPGPSRFIVSRWDVADGLPQTSVTAIAQDDRGFLWVTTFGGLARFDGRSFVRVDPPHADLDGHRFTSLACVGSSVWVGTDHGRLFRFDDYGVRDPIEISLPGGSSDPLWQLLVDGQRIFIAAGRGGVLSLEPSSGRVTRLDEPPLIALSLAIDRQHRVWAAGDRKLRRIGGPEEYPAPEVFSLWASGDSINMSTRSARFTVRDGALIKLSDQGGRTFEDTRHAQTWVANDEGLSLTTVLGQYQLPLPARRKVAPAVRSFFLDANDTLWLASDDHGLYRVRDRHVATVSESAGLIGGSALLVHGLADGSALISTYCHGLQRLLPGRSRTVTRVPGPDDDDCVYSMAPAEGGVWITLSRRIGWFDGERVVEVPVNGATEPVLAEVRALLADGNKLWIGTTSGISLLEGDVSGLRVVRSWTPADGLPHESVFVLAQDGAQLLIGTLRGAARLEPSTGKISPLITSGDAKPAVVRDFLVEREFIWVATYGEGLARVDRSGAAKWLVRDARFCSDELSRLLRVDDDVWFNSNQGVFRATLTDLEAAARGERRLSCRFVESGEGNGGGQPAGTQLGALVAFPTVEGVAMIDPDDLRRTRPTPPLFLERAVVDATELSAASVTSVPSGRRDFTVRLMTPPGADGDLEEPLVVSTLTRDGVESGKHTGGLSANYVELPPGDYLFRAWREGPGGRGEPVELRFTLVRSFGETRLARVGVPFLILSVIGLILRSYIANVRSRARALEEQLQQREETERARRERDELYRTVFDGSPGPLFLFDAKGTLREANPAAQKLMSLTVPLAGLPFLDEKDRPEFLKMLAEATQQHARVELSVTTAPGTTKRLSLDAGPLKWSGASHVLVAATDVTSAREAEAQRAELLEKNASAQRLEGLGRLAAGVAHDFNNVLAALQLQLEDLKSSKNDVAAVQALTGEMEEAVRTGRDLTSRFLVFGKGDTQASTFELDVAVQESKRLLTRLMKGDVTFEVQCNAPGARVSMPRVHLDRVLLNLVLNARDALEGGSKRAIIVRTRRVEQCASASGDELQVLPAPTQPCVVLEIEDGGAGMSEQTLERAFEPFFTTHGAAQGTGLGLTVVHGIALKLGAGLLVSSRQGRESGTRFCVQFPLLRTPSQELQRLTPAALGAKAHRVLVADDTAMLRKSLARVFRGDGWEVLEASDGTQALACCTEQRIDLLITDLMMPGLDGVELITVLRERGDGVPIILLSGYTGDAVARLDLQKAKVEAMDKPFIPEQLLALARRLVVPVQSS
ncbi:MAG: response regulator [Archangium sp.]|nr:response regulator [Archangium sp.]